MVGELLARLRIKAVISEPQEGVSLAKVDLPLLLLFLALGTTVGLFLLDVFPYPFGFVILIMFILLRFYGTRSYRK